MSTAPKVSVIIPNYNHAKYLSKRIESVLDQSYRNFEVLYLDDASIDESAQVFAKYQAEPRIRSVLNQKNSGSAFKQWDKGVKASRGEYIWIAEADDYADSRLMETLVNWLDENPNVGIAFCLSQVVDENDQLVETPHQEEYADDAAWKQSWMMPGQEFNLKYMVHANSIPNASAVVFRKDVYEKAGGAYQKLRLAGDWITWMRMLDHADIAYIAQPFNSFRTHSTTVRNRSVKAGLWAEEKYRVALYIAKNKRLTAQELEKMRHRSMEIWQYALYDSQTRIGWKRNARIFRLARRFDPTAALRFARHTLYRWLQATPLFETARSLGRAVWRRIAASPEPRA